MPEELFQVFLESRERLVAIETKIDEYNKTRDTAAEALATAKRAEGRLKEIETFAFTTNQATEANRAKADATEATVNEMKDASRWTNRYVIGLLVGAVINVIYNAIQGL